jgi:hypothetical protein
VFEDREELRFQFRVFVHEAVDDDREILEEEVVIVSLILHVDVMMSSSV